MTQFEKDMLKVRCGAGDVVIARRAQQVKCFRDEYRKCLNPFRKELLSAEIARLQKELAELRNQQPKRCGA